jgi:hypothetical protein
LHRSQIIYFIFQKEAPQIALTAPKKSVTHSHPLTSTFASRAVPNVGQADQITMHLLVAFEMTFERSDLSLWDQGIQGTNAYFGPSHIVTHSS